MEEVVGVVSCPDTELILRSRSSNIPIEIIPFINVILVFLNALAIQPSIVLYTIVYLRETSTRSLIYSLSNTKTLAIGDMPKVII